MFAIFTDNKIDLNDNYNLLKNNNEIKIWKRKKSVSYFRLLCKFEKVLTIFPQLKNYYQINLILKKVL